MVGDSSLGVERIFVFLNTDVSFWRALVVWLWSSESGRRSTTFCCLNE